MEQLLVKSLYFSGERCNYAAFIEILIGGVDFKNLKVTLKSATVDAPAVTLNYGQFINTVIDFLIVAFSIFLMVKGINSLKRTKQIENKE